MSFLTILSYVCAVAETASLIAALIYFTRGTNGKKKQGLAKNKKGMEDNEIVRKVVSAYYRKAGAFFVVYVFLNFVRRYSGIFG